MKKINLFLVFFLIVLSGNLIAQQCSIVYQQDLSASSAIGFAFEHKWRVRNQTSGCYASNYYLVPQSAERKVNGSWQPYSGMNTAFRRTSGPNQSNTGQSDRFSVSAWNTVDIEINFNVSPSATGEFRMYFDIYDGNGNVLPVLSGGRLYTEFEYTGKPNLTFNSSNNSVTISGTDVSISMRVENHGTTTPSTNSYVGYYLSTNSIISPSDYLIGTDYVGLLTPNQGGNEYSGTIDVTSVSPAIPTGTYYIGYYIDHDYDVNESDENDNRYTFSSSQQVTIGSSVTSDITVSNGAISLSSVQAGNTIYVNCNQNYSGNSTSISNPDVGYYLSTNCTWDGSDVLLGSDWSSIDANDLSDPESATVTIPANTSAGNYYILFVADYLNEVAESDENNNVQCVGTFQVTVPVTSDITVSNGAISLSSVEAGNTIYVSCNQNYSGNSTSISNPDVGYYLSTNCTWDGSDVLLGSDWSSIDANDLSDPESATVTIPANTSAGNYYILFVADYLNEVAESDENNNVQCVGTFQITVPALPANLQLTNSINVNPNPLIQGLNKSITATVINNGGQTFYGTIEMAWHNLSTGSVIPLQSFTNLNVGSNAPFSVPGTVISTPGNYQVKVKYKESGTSIWVDMDTENVQVYPNYDPTYSPPPKNSVPPNSPVNQDPGDPVDVATGAFTWMQLDMSISGRNGDYGLVRYYNSQNVVNETMGYNWSHSFDIYLTVNGNNWTVKHGDGHSDYYVHYDDGSTLPMYVGVTDTMYQQSGNYILEKDNGIKYTFNSSGVLQNITDRNGNATTFTYTSGNLSRVTFSGGRYFDFAYTSNRVTSVTDNANRTVSYVYDGNGDMTGFTDMDNGNYQYAYTNHEMISVQDPKMNTIIQNVYTSNKVTQQTDAASGVFSFQYDTPTTNACTVTDALSNTTIYYHDNAYRLIKKTDELGNHSYYDYNDYNQFIEIVNENDDTVSISHDYKGNVIQIDAPLNTTTSSTHNSLNVPTDITNADGKTINIGYDSNANPTSMNFPNGSSIASTYNPDGQLNTQTDGLGNIVTFQYDNTTGDLTGIVTSTGTYTFSYDMLGRITSVTDRNGKVTQMILDDFGNITKITDPMGYFIELTYDANGNITTFKDKNAAVTTFTYDNKDRMTKVTDALGNETDFVYNLMDQLISVTDARNNTVNYTYDAKGRMVSYSNALGAYTFGYDNIGNRTAVTDALGNTTNIAYDKLNRPVSITNALNETITIVYNVLGQVTLFTDAGGNSTQYEYNDMGWLTKVKDANNGENTFTYDPNGNMLTFIDANGNTTSMTYNDQNLPITQTNGAGYLAKMYYDNEGNLIGKLDANGDSTGVVLNDNYLITQLVFSNGNSYQYGYDNNGALTSMTNTNGTTSFTRNLLGFITQTSDPFGNITKYIYDEVGNRTGTIYSGTDTVNVEYNAVNLPTKVRDWAGNFSTRAYDANGSLTGINNSNGTSTDIARDVIGRVKTYANFQPGNILLSSDTLTYDAIGNIIRRGKYEPIEPNFTNLTDNYTHGNDNRLTSTSNGSVTNNDNGSWTNDGNGSSYVWGENNLLDSYTKNGVTTQNTHDAGRNLIKETKNGVETRYQLDISTALSHVLRELDDQNNVTASYIQAPDGLAWRLDDQGNAQFYSFDYLGNTKALTDDNGNVTDTYSADPFGDFSNHVGSTVQPFQNWGKHGIQYKGDGHYHIRARDYDATTGTFISPDAYPMNLLSTQLVNKYAYAVNNSMSFMDIDGFKPSAVNSFNQVAGIIGNVKKANATINAIAKQGANLLYNTADNRWLAYNRNKNTFDFKQISNKHFGGGTRGRIIPRSTIQNVSNKLSGLNTILKTAPAAKALGTVGNILTVGHTIAAVSASVSDCANGGDCQQATQNIVSHTTGTLGGIAGGIAGAKVGAVAGAKVGAVIGSIIPGAGTVAGAAVGGFIGGVAGSITGSIYGDKLFSGATNKVFNFFK